MWLFTTRGFYSAVQSKTEPDTIVVRARVKDDLFALEDVLGYKPKPYKPRRHTDYPWRIDMPRAEWTKVVSLLALDVDYTNFKDAVTKRQGFHRHDVYLRVWGVLHSLQGKGKSKQRARQTSLDDWPVR